MTSFIVPAHNEEGYLARTLESIHASARSTGEPYEIVVVDDSSTDRTSAIAVEQGARLVSVSYRQIAATRNAGARAARGAILFFVDADTVATPEAVRAGLAALRAGAVGGGCVFRFDCPLPVWGWILYPLGVLGGRLLKLVGGCFLFCTRAAFEAVGGFPESLFAAEELAFIRALKRQGRVVVPGPVVITSGRKLPRLRAGPAIRLLFRVAFTAGRSFRSRQGLEIWYGDLAAASEPRSEPPPARRPVWCD